MKLTYQIRIFTSTYRNCGDANVRGCGIGFRRGKPIWPIVIGKIRQLGGDQ